MDRSKLDAAANLISDYTARHSELCKAHHFTYDHPLFDDFRTAGKPEIVVMGINPGETSTDRADSQRREETWSGWRSCTPSARNWASLCEEYTNSRCLISTELFFWSSANMEEFKLRFGPLWRSTHIDFCIRMNLILLTEYTPRMVVFPGVSVSDGVARRYKLTREKTILDRNEERLVVHYIDSETGLPWIFTKHWTGSFGLTTEQKDIMKNYIQHVDQGVPFDQGVRVAQGVKNDIQRVDQGVRDNIDKRSWEVGQAQVVPGKFVPMWLARAGTKRRVAQDVFLENEGNTAEELIKKVMSELGCSHAVAQSHLVWQIANGLAPQVAI